MGMSIEEAITRYKNNAEYERTHGNLQGCLEFRQLAKWLEQLHKINKIMHKEYTAEHMDVCLVQRLAEIREVLEDGNDD